MLLLLLLLLITFLTLHPLIFVINAIIIIIITVIITIMVFYYCYVCCIFYFSLHFPLFIYFNPQHPVTHTNHVGCHVCFVDLGYFVSDLSPVNSMFVYIMKKKKEMLLRGLSIGDYN